jgi:HSP20 family protein
VARLFNTDSCAWMWDEALAALERAERRHRHFFALVGTRVAQAQPVWEPPVDVFETDHEVWVVIALPGTRASDVALTVQGTELVVRTERAPAVGLPPARIRRLEIPYGVFERRIQLPPGRYVLHDQRMEDGCLQLHLTRE